MKCKYMIEKVLHPTSSAKVNWMWCKKYNKYCFKKCDTKDKNGGQK